MADRIKIEIKPEIAIKIKEDYPEKIILKIEKPITIYLNLRKSLSGDYMIFDHPLYDIVVMPKKNKIVTFSKKNSKLDPYPSQDKYFDYLMRKGMIIQDSVQGGNVFGSLEAVYPINDSVDSIQAILLVTYNFLKNEVDSVQNVLNYDDEVDEYYTDPNDEETTELGEVPHEEKKGTVDPYYNPYGLIYRI